MTAADVEVAAAVVGALMAVLAFVNEMRKQGRARVAQEASERKQIRDNAYAAGVQSQAWLISQLTTERDDARHERDDARAECQQQIVQIANLEAELRQRDRDDRRGAGR